jgi:hypothetical protein
MFGHHSILFLFLVDVVVNFPFLTLFGILVFFFWKNSKTPLQQFGIWVWHLWGIGKRASNRRIYARVGEPRIRLASVFLAGLFVRLAGLFVRLAGLFVRLAGLFVS